MQKEIDIRIIEDVDVDEYVLVHAGFAIQRVSRQDAKETLELLAELCESEE
jgi:hydrogenase expression/formation protein HypC